MNASILEKAILDRISEKTGIFASEKNESGICLIGHSQIDNWDVERLAGLPVRNCGIRGISSFGYSKHILEKELLSCTEDIYLVMHGTNDIVTGYSINEITDSIGKTIEYIRKRNSKAVIYFVSCISVNGRMDRNNKEIETLNTAMREKLNDVSWVDTGALNDEFGNLKQDYTYDGLHLSEHGYEVLKEIIECAIRKRE